MNLLTQDEQEFREYVQQVESQPAFRRLVESGNLRKINFKGRIPRHLYEEFQDQQFVEFMNEFEIEARADWQTDFFREDARRNVKELALKYRVPRGRLIHALEYCRYLKHAWAGDKDTRDNYMRLDDPDFREPPTSQEFLNSEKPYEALSELMEAYEISQSEFVQYFMGEDSDPEWITGALGIPQSAVREIVDLVERVRIASSMQVTVVDTPTQNPSTDEAGAVATIQRFVDPPRAEIHVAAGIEYNSRYQLETVDPRADEEGARLGDLLRLINQRKSLTFRVLMFLYEFQYRYFVSGDGLYLKPLTQAEVSKDLGEHESTVSRILRHKNVDTPDGNFTLKFFCQSKGDVLRRLIAEREHRELSSGERTQPYSDAELSEILEREYDTKISRRTVTYYRNKHQETPKFYTRRRGTNQHGGVESGNGEETEHQAE
ncbi:MAG: hypothetical protein OXN17_19955 [Candidatus Poribacteria bacterium]|nr:hypothetical protein [Candidatus Poribacteria bacterium]